jgi:hypothetical protein
MASSDDDFNKLDSLSDEKYLKLIETFYETVRKSKFFYLILFIEYTFRMQIILRFRNLIWIKNNDLYRNYSHAYVHLIQIPLIYV